MAPLAGRSSYPTSRSSRMPRRWVAAHALRASHAPHTTTTTADRGTAAGDRSTVCATVLGENSLTQWVQPDFTEYR